MTVCLFSANVHSKTRNEGCDMILFDVFLAVLRAFCIGVRNADRLREGRRPEDGD